MPAEMPGLLPAEIADWVSRAKLVFAAEKPAHFTNFQHCDECAEHDQTLLNGSLDGIGLAELGSPAWDPICFATAQGKLYYLPALIRLGLQTLGNEFYLAQLLFHLEVDGAQNDLYRACNAAQRQFVRDFLEYLILTYPDALQRNFCADDALRVFEKWSQT